MRHSRVDFRAVDSAQNRQYDALRQNLRWNFRNLVCDVFHQQIIETHPTRAALFIKNKYKNYFTNKNIICFDIFVKISFRCPQQISGLLSRPETDAEVRTRAVVGAQQRHRFDRNDNFLEQRSESDFQTSIWKEKWKKSVGYFRVL